MRCQFTVGALSASLKGHLSHIVLFFKRRKNALDQLLNTDLASLWRRGWQHRCRGRRCSGDLERCRPRLGREHINSVTGSLFQVKGLRRNRLMHGALRLGTHSQRRSNQRPAAPSCSIWVCIGQHLRRPNHMRPNWWIKDTLTLTPLDKPRTRAPNMCKRFACTQAKEQKLSNPMLL